MTSAGTSGLLAGLLAASMVFLLGWSPGLRHRSGILTELGSTPRGGVTEARAIGRTLWLSLPLRGRANKIPPDSAEVASLVAQVSALLAAGARPGAAWRSAGGISVDHLGTPDRTELAARVGPSAAAALIAATRLSQTVGAPLRDVLRAVTDSLVASWEADAERDAALAGPRTTARILMWLPAAGAALGWMLGVDPLGSATSGGFGSLTVLAGLVFLLMGRRWTNSLIEDARREGS